MTYDVRISHRVEKELFTLSPELYERVYAAIALLASEPRPASVKKLRGRLNTYRVRVGNYRIIYRIDDRAHVVDVIECGHRRDVYH